MDSGRSLPPRSSHSNSSSFETQSHHSSSSGGRKFQRKSKKGSGVLCEVNGRTQGANSEQGYPLFNNRSLSMISTMHHLNPHRKVAMSPEVLREAEEQATTLKKAVKQLQEQLDKANREKARIHRFLSDLLFTLNARGYESVHDHEGTLVDLNKCKGETYLELKGRDLKQRVNVRRQGGQDFLLKAVIGNQERVIQSLMYKLDSVGRDILLQNRLCVEDTPSHADTVSSIQDSAKIASLESEVLQLVSLIEGACRKCPDMYPALRDYYYLNECDTTDMSPRNPVLQNLLRKCEQIAGEAQTGQLIDLFNSSTGSKMRPKSRQNTPNSRNNATKPVKTRSESKSKSSNSTSTLNKAPRYKNKPVASDTGTANGGGNSSSFPLNDFFMQPPPPHYTGEIRGSNILDENHLKPLNGGSKSDSSFKDKLRTTRSPSPCSNNSTRRSCSSTTCSNNNNTNMNNNNISGGEPSPPSPPSLYANSGGGSSSIKYGNVEPSPSVTVCPYCQRKFGLEESISEIKNHIEIHIFAGDTVIQKSF